MTGPATLKPDLSRGDVERILLVHGGLEHTETLDLIRDTISGRTETVDDVYEAVARVGLCRADEGIRTVVVPVTIPEFSAARIIEAFRLVDGRVRLVLLVPTGRHDAIEAGIAAGFDDAVEIPTTSTRLRTALGVSTPRASIQDQPTSTSDAEHSAPRIERPLPQEPTHPSTPTSSDEPDADDAPLMGPESPEDLGDVDLVGSVIENDGMVRSIALAMIRTHLRTQDVHLLHPEDDGHGDARPSAPIHFSGTMLGSLVSTTIGIDDLTRWAEWLGHWLALDRHLRGLETLCETDELTGAGNRRAFERILLETLDSARRERRIVTLMVFDIDDFKRYNDEYGHEAGDEVLRETVELLRVTIRRGDHVFRIGGDEFVVSFSDQEGPRGERSNPPESVEQIAHRFQSQVCDLRFPQIGLNAPGTLSISAGLSTFPWDGHDGPSLLRHADQLALESKRSGKNAITFGPGARSRCDAGNRPDEDSGA
ncbi:MAG: GGDEF domain-containing protein [Planctomycetota bacterium]